MPNHQRRFSATQQSTVKDLQRIMAKIGATSLRIDLHNRAIVFKDGQHRPDSSANSDKHNNTRRSPPLTADECQTACEIFQLMRAAPLSAAVRRWAYQRKCRPPAALHSGRRCPARRPADRRQCQADRFSAGPPHAPGVKPDRVGPRFAGKPRLGKVKIDQRPCCACCTEVAEGAGVEVSAGSRPRSSKASRMSTAACAPSFRRSWYDRSRNAACSSGVRLIFNMGILPPQK